MKITWYANELLWSGSQNKGHHHLDGPYAKLADRDSIRCVLARSAQALLSVHYGMVYGQRAGFVDFAADAGWTRGPVADSTQDECSPFTYDNDKFNQATKLEGSVGRYKPLDTTYFESNCLTEIPEDVIPKSSFTYNLPRPYFFVKGFSPVKCAYFRQRCRLVTQDQFNALPTAVQNKLSSAGRPLVTPGPVADPCPELLYPDSCFNGVGECTCKNGDERDRACPDQVTSQGLHNYVIAMSDAALQFASTPAASLSASDQRYRFLMDYDKSEMVRGLVKAILLHQHEAIIGMRENTSLTIIAFSFIIVLIFLQYVLLGMRIESLIVKVDHVTRIVERLEGHNQGWSGDKQKKKGTVHKQAGIESQSDGHSSNGSGSSDEEPEGLIEWCSVCSTPCYMSGCGFDHALTYSQPAEFEVAAFEVAAFEVHTYHSGRHSQVTYVQ